MRATSTGDREIPYCVAIVAMGPSRNDYITDCIEKSSRFQVADETWAINAMAGVIDHDRAIIMDALPYFTKAAREETPALVGYGDWLHKHPGPIYTQKHYPDFPGSVKYPLEEVLNELGYCYFNTTTAYALGLAIAMRVKRIKLYGMDFTYNDNKGLAEAGRACLEYWVAIACHRGIKVNIAKSSTLCDQSLGRPLYGYSIAPTVTHEGGKFVVRE